MEDKFDIRVRRACPRDIPKIVALERDLYGSAKMEYYCEDHVWTWFRVNPEGLTVAERGSTVVGYSYSQRVDFDFEKIGLFTTHDQATDSGYTAATHRPNGNALYGVTVCSAWPGAGWHLMADTFALARRLGTEYTMGMSRMPRFDRFMKKNGQDGNLIPDSFPERDLALWYALETARIVNGTVWPNVGPKPDLPLPELRHPDPVIVHHLRFRNHGLAALLPNAVRDPQSRNYAALIVGRTADIH
ncbi:hypothetical protein JW899_03430 [Candidatus Uhrbacteria bacterium]|nr:hypothetical protein [Candidatus Uhrbacteria bacterium]